MHSIIVSLFVLLLVCVFCWLYIYRSIGQGNPSNHPRYRLYQSLIGLIATLVILLTLLIVFSSDPGNPDNKTRFLVIGRQRVGPSGNDKTSILVSTRNEPGALYRVLEPFHRHSISLTRIETRPAKSGTWSYVFFIDFDGHISDPAIEPAMREVADVAMEVRSLGSYPQAVV